MRCLVSGIPLPLEQRDPAAPPVTVGNVLALFGLDGLNTIVTQAGYRGRAMWGETWVEAPAPRKGLLSLSDGEPLTLDSLPPLPTGLTTFAATRISLAKLYDEALAIVRQVLPLAPNEEAEAEFEEFLAVAEARLGFEIRDDLLAHLGSLMVMYDDPRQGLLSLGQGGLIELSNAEGFRKTLDKTLAMIDSESQGEFTVRRYTKHEREVVIGEAREVPLFAQALCVTDRWLVLGTPQTIEAALLRLDGRLPTWKPGPEHQQALHQMPSEFSAITVADPRGTVNVLMGLAPMALGFAKTGIRASGEFPPDFDIPLNVEDLRPAELVSGPLFPNVLVAEVTDEGSHYQSRASLPGIPSLASGDAATVGAVTGVGVALLLPAVQAAREAARREQSKNNLKQLAIAIHNYEATYGHLPSGTVPNADLEPEERLSWMVSLLPFLEQQALYRQIDQTEGWQSRENLRATANVIAMFLNPQAVEGETTTLPDGTEVGVTHYVGIGGVGEDGPFLPANDPKSGMFGIDRKSRFADVHDGLSNTVMISEATGDVGPWAAGGRATVRSFTQQPYINGPDGIGSRFRGGCNMAFGDGAVKFISSDIDPSVMEALATQRGGEVGVGF